MIDWEDIKASIAIEKRGMLLAEAVSDDTEFHSGEETLAILAMLQEIITPLQVFFKQYPSLESLFKKEFVDFKDFCYRDYIIEIALYGEYLFIDKEIFPFYVDGQFKKEFLNDYVKFFTQWSEQKKRAHQNSLQFIRDKLTIKTPINELECHCVECIAEYRTAIRNIAYQSGIEIINCYAQQLQEGLNEGIDRCSSLFYALKNDIRNHLKSFRQKLKRASINKLELELKRAMNERFNHPAPMAQEYSVQLKKMFQEILRQENIRRDLITDEQYMRFFTQLKSNLWKNRRYLEREFRKLLKSVLLLKRQDISSKILIEYLGEFWIHSNARQIRRKIIYHAGPTNSGKTYHAIEALSKVKKGCYLAPLRLLAGELFDTLNSKGVKTSLLTGEEVIEVEGATHYSSTIEMARFEEVFDCCVIDEIQMISDSQRGWAWTRALINMFAPEIHICGDASVLDLVEKIVAITGDELEVRYYERMTKLEVEERKIKLGELEKGDAVIVFSRRNALKYKRDLEYLGFKVSIVYGRLSPEVRREQARKFDKEETDVIVSTDAISMGMNLPIRRIVFSTLSKFINSKEYPISASEIKQIAGRAGRYQRFPIGYVNCLTRVENGLERIAESLACELEQKEVAMVGPDLDIFRQVNQALSLQGLPVLSLPEFLRLFNTMDFKPPFCCVNLSEMIELAEMVEEADIKGKMSDAEIFGFACAPVNLGLIDHVQYYVQLLHNYAFGYNSNFVPINGESEDIDYLETSIKCMELYQWLARHFNFKNFSYDENKLQHNKVEAIEKLNALLSKKIIRTCSSCGAKLDDSHRFNICESCFKSRRFSHGRKRHNEGKTGKKSYNRKSSYSKRSSTHSNSKRMNSTKSYRAKKKK